MNFSLGFLMGIDIPGTLLGLVVFSFVGLGIFLLLQVVFQKVLAVATPRTKTIVFLTLFLTPLVVLLIVVAVYVPLQKYSDYSNAKAYADGVDSLNRLENSPYFDLDLPAGITLDTLIYTDSAANTEVYSFIPMAGIAALDTAVKSAIEKKRTDFIRYAHGVINGDSIFYGFGSEFTTEILSVHRDEKLISYLFKIIYYHPAMSQPVSNYYSYNFNSRNNKQIMFGDYFIADTKADTAFLVGQLTNSIKRQRLSIDKLHEIDFAIKNVSIVFGFDEYEIAPYAVGAIEAKVAKQTLIRNIRAAFR
jgi:hypothetical protein